MLANPTLTAVPGLKVGHWTNREGATGCTVILCPQGAVGGVDVRGSAPGTRENQLLNPVNTVQTVHAILLSGGSAFGLAAADGVMQWLEAHGHGFDVGVARVPIVPGAVIFDLPLGDPKARPDAAAGFAACEAATEAPVAQGIVGAGTGATAGDVLGFKQSTKSGLGSAARELPGGVIVAALAVVNPFGEVRDPVTGRVLAGARRPEGGFVDTLEMLAAFSAQTHASLANDHPEIRNTTLAVVATNAALTKPGATKVAQMAHDGLARVIRPIHTMFDGDTIFALSLGDKPGNVSLVGAVAAEVVAEAVLNGVRAAEGLAGLPAARDLGVL